MSRQGAIRLAVRVFVRLAFAAYFRRVHVRDIGLAATGGPLLLVANHPNSLVDPALLLHVLGRPVHFGARHGLFVTPLAPVLRALGAIPLVRARDAPGRGRENLGAIDRYVELLGRGQATAIFPEGISQDSLQLAPVRNGAARIALEAEAAGDFRLGVRVIPVGLQFEPRRRFRGEAFVRFGRPIQVTDLAGLYAERPREAQRQLTSRIQAALAEQSVHVDQEERAWLVERLSEVYYQRIRRTGLLMTGRDGLRGELRYRIAACINYFSRTDEAVVRGVERSLGRYDRLREAAGVERRLIEEPAYLLPGPLAPIQAGLECALGIVPALFGGLTGGVPYVVTRGLARRLVLRSRHPPSLSLLHILIGAVAFPLFWGSVLFMVWRAGGVQAAAVLAVLLVPSGLFTLFFVRRVGKLAVHVSGRLASLMRLGETARVRQAQSELMLEMDSVRARYIREVFEPEGSGRT